MAYNIMNTYLLEVQATQVNTYSECGADGQFIALPDEHKEGRERNQNRCAGPDERQADRINPGYFYAV